MLVLSGIAIIIIGFALRVNPLLVVTVAAFASAAAAGHGPVEVVGMIGKAFVSSRFMAVAWLALPTIGLLERAGLRDRASDLVRRLRGATTARVLLGYLALRQLTAALGLISLGGHVQMVRPIIAPMAEAAEAGEGGDTLDPALRDAIRAHAAAVDNIGVMFGEDVFVAVGSILLIRAILEQEGIIVAPLHVALWAIPTAIAAFVVHAVRLFLLDRRLKARRA
ncbi:MULTISPECIES: DUF969 domain-containing protein [unclassified Sphingomonas]|jgi:uncharacterized membrane protein|uniref:DUF969 domain-containing protein n=1 Tax=unclassified Sphingomonas TaxID=196159 RepID=UPI000E100D1B|nr:MULTISPECIES: DUF969 family protein [unclassified Sphingomonas]AXJ96262.1 DUF969 domain-containing protein [Sphingomonas sp. FARSPH]